MAGGKSGFKEIDLHNMTVDEARRLLIREIANTNGEFELSVIHGCHHGTALMHMVRNQLKSPRIDYISPSLTNPGKTTIYLKRKK